MRIFKTTLCFILIAWGLSLAFPSEQAIVLYVCFSIAVVASSIK